MMMGILAKLGIFFISLALAKTILLIVDVARGKYAEG